MEMPVHTHTHLYLTLTHLPIYKINSNTSKSLVFLHLGRDQRKQLKVVSMALSVAQDNELGYI